LHLPISDVLVDLFGAQNINEEGNTQPELAAAAEEDSSFVPREQELPKEEGVTTMKTACNDDLLQNEEPLEESPIKNLKKLPHSQEFDAPNSTEYIMGDIFGEYEKESMWEMLTEVTPKLQQDQTQELRDAESIHWHNQGDEFNMDSSLPPTLTKMPSGNYFKSNSSHLPFLLTSTPNLFKYIEHEINPDKLNQTRDDYPDHIDDIDSVSHKEKRRSKKLMTIRNINAAGQSSKAFSLLMSKMGEACNMEFNEEKQVWEGNEDCIDLPDDINQSPPHKLEPVKSPLFDNGTLTRLFLKYLLKNYDQLVHMKSVNPEFLNDVDNAIDSLGNFDVTMDLSNTSMVANKLQNKQHSGIKLRL
jgi:hypothetical protein